jgi:uncharacterized membrane protein
VILAASNSSNLVLISAVFLACAVEMVEALTIVVAVGTTRSWRSALEGVVVAVLALTVLVAIFGPALVKVPLSSLRLVVGSVLLIFGLQWLRKAILRSTGYKAKHDEDVIFTETVAELTNATGNRDRLAFIMSFKGVFLEGLEVVVTVLALGASSHQLGLASLAAGVALVMVAVVGAIVAKQLSGVPENAMKMAVGIMLVSYGTFWSGEGLKISWPGNDLMIPMLVLAYAVFSWILIAILKQDQSETKVVSL